MEEFVIAALVDSRERNYQERIRLECIRDVSNPFQMPEEKFKKLFRLPKSGAQHLINILDDPRLDKGFIPKHIKVLAALHFYAQGSYQAEVGQDNLLGLSQPTVSRCLTVTSDVIVERLTPRYIKFPSSEREIEAAKRSFQQLYEMPNTLGAVDGTHISITKPPLSHPTAPGNIFFNRKGFYSINCQIVCSADGKIIGLNPNFPGSTHDAAIWRASKIHRFLRNKYISGERNQWLLGDKGYPLQPWLMTPLMEPSSEAERSYNYHHAKARNVVEMCNGRLKNKFRCLHRHRTLHYEPTKAAKVILACCTLYNMFIDVLTALVVSINLIAADSLFYIYCTYLRMHFRILGHRFENVVTASREDTRDNMRKCVKRHQELIELVNLVETLFSNSMLCNLIFSTVMLCLAGFNIMVVKKISTVLRYGPFLVMSLSQSFLICYFGDLLMESSIQISEAVYSCRWYDSEPAIKSSVLVVLTRSQTPCKVTAGNFVDLNLTAFTAILSRSWSCFALLQTMYT